MEELKVEVTYLLWIDLVKKIDPIQIVMIVKDAIDAIVHTDSTNIDLKSYIEFVISRYDMDQSIVSRFTEFSNYLTKDSK
jgi:hypothetical protein